ncbi:MAG: hypothetical protein OXN89_11735 [Bryobacterales bacterium]|nr:hypothetical protein [Bryobacterales bacterium]
MVLFVALLLTLPNAAHASARGSWDAVREVRPGKRIRVVLASEGRPQLGIVLQGRFASATEDQIALMARDGGTRILRREEVHQVRVRVPFMKRRVAWLVAGPIGGLFTGLAFYTHPIYATTNFGFFFLMPYSLLARIGRTVPVYTAAVAPNGSQQVQPSREGNPAVPSSAGETAPNDRGR